MDEADRRGGRGLAGFQLERVDGRGRGVEMFVIDEEVELPARQRREAVLAVGIRHGRIIVVGSLSLLLVDSLQMDGDPGTVFPGDLIDDPSFDHAGFHQVHHRRLRRLTGMHRERFDRGGRLIGWRIADASAERAFGQRGDAVTAVGSCLRNCMNDLFGWHCANVFLGPFGLEGDRHTGGRLVALCEDDLPLDDSARFGQHDVDLSWDFRISHVCPNVVGMDDRQVRRA